VPGGTLKAEPGYSLSIDAEVLHGSDYIRADSGGPHLRLDVSSTLKDKSGAYIRFKYTGVLDSAGEAGKVLANKVAAPATTAFGDVFTHVSFETGSEELRALERKVYVGSGHFVLVEGKGTAVEYKISEVVV
jgi:hypothetical protein